MPGVLWCDVPRDCGSYCTFVPRGEKKKRGKYIFAFPQVESGTISSCGAFHSSFLKPWDFCRVNTYKPLYQRPVKSWHPVSPPGVSEGWWNLGTPCEADGEGWVLSSDAFFCCCFHSLSVVFFLLDLPRHFHTGMRGWESWHEHGSHAGGFNGVDFVALVSCPISPMDVIEKPKYSIGPKRSEF